MSLCCLVACTHYDVTTKENKKLVDDMTNINEYLPKGVNLLFKMIHRYHNHKPMVPILPATCYSTAGTTDYKFKGYGKNRKGLSKSVSNKSLKNAGLLSRYRINNSKVVNEMRVKLTYTFSAAGTMTPIFISILGLMEKELPEDERITLKIEGLSVGCGGVTVATKQCGILLLVRGQKGLDKIRYNYYYDNILLPFAQ